MEYVSDGILTEVAKNLNIKKEQAETVLKMLEEGCTVPFIARYRKEQTGALTEDAIRMIEEQYTYGVNLQKRKDDVIRLIEEKQLMTPELKEAILSATKLIEVEDLYRPFKEKKKTKATEAIRLGLDPLADIMLQFPMTGDKDLICAPFLKEEVTDTKTAIQMAGYIIAERISDNADYRKSIRENTKRFGKITASKKKNAVDENEVYANYYEYSEMISRLKPHRTLAINRAENEKVITVSIETDELKDVEYLKRQIIKKKNSLFETDIESAIADSYKRLIYPSIEREIRAELTDFAENQAIEIFGMNLKNLLLQPPMKDKTVLGVDPAFRTGCKLAVVDKTGKKLETGVIYPNEKSKGSDVDPALLEKSKVTVLSLCKKYNVDLIAIGNGTASRETESFISDVIKEFKLPVKYVIVSEAGASVYSASELAKKEFPELEVEKRSAISIARRLQDPLSELVKIDPKSIGVGQYQHDVSQPKLSSTLDSVVEDVVNKVGVNLNFASASLLGYVSGLNKGISASIEAYRDENGPFKSREALKKVPKLGGKSFEQAVGFLRVLGGTEPLDATSIHPESYDAAKKVLAELNLDSSMFGSNEAKASVDACDRKALMDKLGLDKYTLNDILDAIVAPMRDPRDEFTAPKLREDVLHLEDLKIGDELEGTVRNVVDFGVFVDCGVKYDGLVHISKMSTNYIKHPSDLVSIGDLVKVYVLDVDVVKHKLALSMIKAN